MPLKTFWMRLLKAYLVCFLMLMAACVGPAAGKFPDEEAPTPQPALTEQLNSNRKLIFAEEFNQETLNEDIWHTQYRWGPTNPPELQFYTPKALSIRNGMLRIKAEKRKHEEMDYTSGVIASFDQFTFTYGYVEMRAKLPAGQGLWPAFWLHLNNDDLVGEIDIFEMLGHEPEAIYMTSHFPGPNGESEDETHVYRGKDFSRDFHTYAVDWQPDAITWYIDGVRRSTISHDVPNGPMYILANLAVGGEWGGYPDKTTHFPAYFDIDYIRVYQ